MKNYDYIIAGAGCAGLSLAIHLIVSKKFSDKKILIIDRQPLRTNDRTWCFWETEPGLFEPVVSKKWGKLNFLAENFKQVFDIAPYEYKLIKAIDYYNYADQIISLQPNIDRFFGDITKIEEGQNLVTLQVGDQSFAAPYLFNSLAGNEQHGENEIVLQQHFKGLLIECPANTFNPDLATLMDFTIEQPGETAFMYILPVSDRRALVEYTLFSKLIWPSEAYDHQLQTYIKQQLKIDEYKIVETELGSIPMSSHSFKQESSRIIKLGISGGQTKASTGYTFKFIQQHSEALVKELVASGTPKIKTRKLLLRFHFYDSVLLRVLAKFPKKGAAIFERMFAKNSVVSVLHFLNNSSSINEEIKLTMSLQKSLFIPAALRELYNLFKK